MKINKKDIIRLLEQIAIYMELKGENPFKIAAFRKAAGALETDDRSLSEITTFTDIPGIGKGTGAVIDEFIKEGTSSVLQELKEEVPKGLIPLLQLPGLGGKKISKLYQELGVEDINSLKEACENNQVAGLKGFGKKTQDNILASIAQLGSQPDRLPIGYMLPIARHIESYLEQIKEICAFSKAGSLRRTRETIKDLDFIIATNSPLVVRDQLLAIDGVKEATASGETKVTIIMNGRYEISVDFRLVAPEEYATALHHFTGSKDHNVRMRQLAKERGEKISEYGVENVETGEVLTFKSEQDFFSHFGLPFIPPEIREDGKEIEIYSSDTSLISLEDIRGDLHMHTTWSDGAYSIEEMVEACRKKGYKYMAITDHSEFLRVANGLSVERIKLQNEEIRALNEKYDDILILSGIEMDILPDGSLNYSDDVLAELDFVIASIHSSFSQPREKIMKRLYNALKNPHVDMIAHPTGRLIGRRDGYDVDIDLLIKLAKETNTALELNANPERLDLSAEYLKKAIEAGVMVSINTDAHNIQSLEFMDIGVSSAKKGWVKKTSVLNAMEPHELLQFLKRND
ncbi:DNA polymerase/3'-5' exonuclease PolX [Lederbergia wuyishanensis]|uniref:DNA-directed DNA polymerase n=1 Tax=Lederbergia wuyishanensis TaxID=1347903 RepID=A0ABU0D5B6_9BACI|nr:DNA polymerase/3'-5' exonuclease PolX [Lederbergia wuyishanensis]MCJ8009879.1 DNA polymerase/3'-5' exonuclease PolX [Lederbergia wuyishanensis]MDQ0343584.1 DNA polymerase (family 10) [Lederbergia wuyishanensis]